MVSPSALWPDSTPPPQAAGRVGSSRQTHTWRQLPRCEHFFEKGKRKCSKKKEHSTSFVCNKIRYQHVAGRRYLGGRRRKKAHTARPSRDRVPLDYFLYLPGGSTQLAFSIATVMNFNKTGKKESKGGQATSHVRFGNSHCPAFGSSGGTGGGVDG